MATPTVESASDHKTQQPTIPLSHNPHHGTGEYITLPRFSEKKKKINKNKQNKTNLKKKNQNH